MEEASSRSRTHSQKSSREGSIVQEAHMNDPPDYPDSPGQVVLHDVSRSRSHSRKTSMSLESGVQENLGGDDDLGGELNAPIGSSQHEAGINGESTVVSLGDLSQGHVPQS
eukprot:3084179-Amphidinium_carterae.1